MVHPLDGSMAVILPVDWGWGDVTEDHLVYIGDGWMKGPLE